MAYQPQGSAVGPLIVAILSFQQQCDVDQASQRVICLAYQDINGGAIVSAAEMSGAVITISRNRAGVNTTIVSSAAMDESTGFVTYSYTFPSASWAIGDIVLYYINLAVVTRGGKTFSFPNIYGWGWITS